MKLLHRHARIAIEATAAVVMITLSIPALCRALRAFDVRILIGLFVFLAGFILSRDPHAFDSLGTLAKRLWTQHKHTTDPTEDKR